MQILHNKMKHTANYSCRKIIFQIIVKPTFCTFQLTIKEWTKSESYRNATFNLCSQLTIESWNNCTSSCVAKNWLNFQNLYFPFLSFFIVTAFTVFLNLSHCDKYQKSWICLRLSLLLSLNFVRKQLYIVIIKPLNVFFFVETSII